MSLTEKHRRANRKPKNATVHAMVWLSYDLGVRGDYESLYSWLDSHGAKECGDSVAVLSFEFRDSLPDELKAALQENITTDKRTRIYVVYRDQTTDKTRGKFLFGGRRAAAWTGFAASDAETTDDEV